MCWTTALEKVNASIVGGEEADDVFALDDELAGAVFADDEALGGVGVEESRDSVAWPLLNVLSKITQRPE